MTVLRGKGAVLREAGSPFEVVDNLEFDSPGAGEVLVRIVASGMCHTDLGVQDHGMPFTLPGIVGHEGGGIVEQVGAGVTSVTPGDKVLLSFTFCGECASCRSNHPAYCETWFARNLLGMLREPDSAGVRADGEELHTHFLGQSSFAEYAIADARSVVKVAPTADLVTLAPLGCGIITGVGSMWNVVDPDESSTVAVYGTGAVGLSAVWAAAQRRPEKLIAIDRVASRLEIAREFGATHTIDASTENVESRLFKLTNEVGVSHSFDTTASPHVGSGAVESAAMRGKVVICGVAAPGTELPVSMTTLLAGRKVEGVTYGDAVPSELIARLAALHSEGVFPLERIERTYALADIQQAADDMRSGVTVKPVIVF